MRLPLLILFVAYATSTALAVPSVIRDSVHRDSVEFLGKTGRKTIVADPFIGMPTRLVLSTNDVLQSMAWWARLGFSPVARAGDKADSCISLTDGQIVLSLVKISQPTPVLMFRTPKMLGLKDTLEYLGITVNVDVKGPTYGEIRFRSPADVFLAIRSEADEPLLPPTGKENIVCGKLTELSIGTSFAVGRERKFWELLGWLFKRGGSEPYNFALMSDGVLTIGIHEERDIPTLSLTYFATDMEDRILRLRKSGIDIYEELPSEEGRVANCIVQSPEGMRIQLFEGMQD